MGKLEHLHRRLTLQGPENFQEQVLVWILIPLGLLYGGLMWIRSLLYQAGVLSTCYSKIPVVSVGNLAVGGTGKTPFTDYLLDYFENKGLKPAVVSRGYGGSFSGKFAVVSDGNGPVLSADYCGDEPYLLAKKHPQSMVIISPQRRDAIEWLNANRDIDVIILDDAFQHLQVERDLNIVLLDAARPYGNGYPLPAGLLREFPCALNRADLFVLTRSESEQAPFTGQAPTIRCRHQISDQLESLEGQKITVGDLVGKKGVAFAGIARPEIFFKSLDGLGLDLVDTFSFSDHERYSAQVLSQLSTTKCQIDYFITTEKDAVKIAAESLPGPCYVAPLNIEIFETAILEMCLDSICDGINDDNR